MTVYSFERELRDRLVIAARRAFGELFRTFPAHHFYYCSLTTSGEGHTPAITAWSEEALDEVVEAEGGDLGLRAELKWSYADSPFYCFGEGHFSEVRRLLEEASDEGDRDWTSDAQELELRLAAMESTMGQLDAEGLFGQGEERNRIVINAEVMPPDESNVGRARRLNPQQALRDWLAEAAED